MQRIRAAQFKNKNLADYKNKETIYIPRSIAKEFVKDFYANFTQGHNKATMLVKRLSKKEIV